jgi:hypothetical protein
MKRMVLRKLDAVLRKEAEAIRDRNGFSRLLHERCMDTLRRRGLHGAAEEPERARRLWRLAVPLGVAAAAALAAWLILHPPQTPQTPVPEMVQIQPTPVLPSPIGREIQGPARATSDSLEERKYAYLDRDAQRLLTFLANQLPDFNSGSDTGKSPEGPR